MNKRKPQRNIWTINWGIVRNAGNEVISFVATQNGRVVHRGDRFGSLVVWDISYSADYNSLLVKMRCDCKVRQEHPWTYLESSRKIFGRKYEQGCGEWCPIPNEIEDWSIDRWDPPDRD